MNTWRFIWGKGRHLSKHYRHTIRKQWWERMRGKKFSPCQRAVYFSLGTITGIICIANYVYYSLENFDRWREAIDVFFHPQKMRKLIFLNSYHEGKITFRDIPPEYLTQSICNLEFPRYGLENIPVRFRTEKMYIQTLNKKHWGERCTPELEVSIRDPLKNN